MRNRTWRILMFGLVAVVCSFTLTLLAVSELTSSSSRAMRLKRRRPLTVDWQTLVAGGGNPLQFSKVHARYALDTRRSKRVLQQADEGHRQPSR